MTNALNSRVLKLWALAGVTVVTVVTLVACGDGGGGGGDTAAPALGPTPAFSLQAKTIGDAGNTHASSVSSRLFPDISEKDFPNTAYTAILRRVQASPQAVRADSFHSRTLGLGFAAQLHATQTFQPQTGNRKLTLRRFDDGCVNAADKIRVRPELECAELIAEEITPDVLKLVYRHRYFDYQVQMTLVQSPVGSGTWQLLKTGRRGEPNNMGFSVRRSGTDTLQINWHLDNARAGDAIDLNLGASITPSEFKQSGLNDVELGMLTGADFFYDLAQLYAPNWVPYAHGQIIDTPAPSPSDNDPHECKVVRSCSAEYQSCTPTTGGWYVCNFTDGTQIDWGGGFGEDSVGGGGGNSPPPDTLPDWVIGDRLSTPRFIPPYFNGLYLDTTGDPTRYLQYHITSLLSGASTKTKLDPNYHLFVKHRVTAGLAYDSTGVFVFPTCGEARSDEDRRSSATDVFVGDSNTIVQPTQGQAQCACSLPTQNGLYVLKYILDPNNAWAEGSAGESNNIGFFDGFLYVNQ
jgi:hypothetical protein